MSASSSFLGDVSRRQFVVAGAALAGLALFPGLRAVGTPDQLEAWFRECAQRTPELARGLTASVAPDRRRELVAGLRGRLAAMPAADVAQVKQQMTTWIRDDFLSARTVSVRGAVLAETEAALVLAGLPA